MTRMVQNAHSFSEEAIRSAEHFRLIMNAMARPGIIQDVPSLDLTAKPMNNAITMIALTLCDHETTVWLDDSLSTQEIRDFIQFHCGASITDNKSNADFAFYAKYPSEDALADFPIGVPDYPDRSTTIVIGVDELSQDGLYTLTGPGIQSTHSLKLSDIGSDFPDFWRSNNRNFPLGIDVIFAAENALVGLPRTTRIVEVN